MDLQYINITYNNCKSTKRVVLNTNDLDEWDINKLKSYLIDPDTISSIDVGPSTVLVFYENGDFSGKSHAVINDTMDKKTTYTFFPCPKDNNKWFVSLNSFRIYTYDYYNKLYGIQYCDSNDECGRDQMCMCENGETNPLWCVNSKKRCQNNKWFMGNYGLPINNEDTIKTSCLTSQLGNSSGNISFEELKNKFMPCMTDKMNRIDKIEGFSGNMSIFEILIYVLIVVIIFYIGKYFYNNL